MKQITDLAGSGLKYAGKIFIVPNFTYKKVEMVFASDRLAIVLDKNKKETSLLIDKDWSVFTEKKQIAQYVYRHCYSYIVSVHLLSKEGAEKWCEINKSELVLWPYGEIIEVDSEE